MIYKLKPAVKNYMWGGTKLKMEFGKECGEDILAETWELSCHKDGESVIATGEAAGKTLSQWLAENPQALGTNAARYKYFPVLIKLIDAEKDLSIQVHPGNTYALENEGECGKTEMWYVVSARDNAFLYYGFTRVISKEEFARHIEENTLTQVLRAVPVKPGDIFFIEPGTIHAIGAGILIAEIQQSSNVTYRVYDYGRRTADGNLRELHVEKAMDVTTLAPAKTDYQFGEHIGACAYFTVDENCIHGKMDFLADDTSFQALLVLDGNGTIACRSESLIFSKGNCLFIPAGSGRYTIKGNCHTLTTFVGV